MLDLSAIDADIQQLDVQIAQLERNKIQLKRRRNAAIPISQIPPELLMKIFSFSLTRFSGSDLAELPQEIEVNPSSAEDLAHARAVHAKRRVISEGLRRPQILSLCQVNHGWRELAFDCREMWNHIQVQLRTAPGLLELMWRNAGEGSIQLDLSCEPVDVFRQEDDLPTFSVLKALVKKDLRRLKTVGIYCRAVTVVAAMEGCGEELESLVVVESVMQHRFAASPKFLEGGAPNLRHLELTGVIIPWTSPIFTSSPHLAHLALSLTPPPTPKSIAELAVVLRHAQRLKVLKLTICYAQEEDEEMEYFLSATRDQAAIPLANLDVLDLDCRQRGPMGAILALLHIPKDTEQLVLTSADRVGGNVDRILDFARRGRSPEEFIAPEEMEFDYGKATCWRERQSQSIQKGVAGVNNSLSRAHKQPSVWQGFTVLAHREGLSFNLTIRPPPWSFVNLREISVICSDVPTDFWRRLASASALEVVQVYGLSQRDFVVALGEEMEATDSASPRPLSPSRKTTELAKTTGQSSLFPSLRVVIFPRYNWHIDQAATTGRTASDDANERFLQQVAKALSRWGGRLKELKFESCKSLVPGSGSLDELSLVTDSVIWDGRLLLPKPDSERLQKA